MSRPSRIAVVLLLAAGAARAIAAEPTPVVLPKDFRTWTHVRSMVVTDPDEGMYGFHDVYANAAALKELRSGKGASYPDGATFVVSIAEVKKEKGTVSAGAKQRDVVQVKDRRAKETGGWRYASFDPSGKPLKVEVASCAACHAQAAAADMVFTKYTP